MVFNIMIGVKRAIDSVSEIPLIQELQDYDYKIKSIHQIGSWQMNSADQHKACTFYDYAPMVF